MKALRILAVLPLFAALLLLSGAAARPASALNVPPLTGRVNDTAHILSPGSVRVLEQTLTSLEQTDSTQIVVLTIPSLQGESLEPYALKVAETWKIGQKGVDNGALLLIAVQDRKIRIETGYGLEGRLTDLVAGRIIRERITPAFKRGNYDQGVIEGVAAMAAAVKGEYAGKGDRKTGSRPDPAGLLAFLVIGLFFIGNAFRRKKILAAAAGGVYAPVVGLFFPLLSGWLLLLLLIPAGIIGALAASVLAGAGSSRSPVFFPGGFGGGSFGGGGFSGGGGGFGGGGASGGW